MARRSSQSVSRSNKMSDFIVVVVPEAQEITTTPEETTVVVNPLPDSSIEVVAPVSDVSISESIINLEILQNVPFTLDIIEARSECCDPSTVDIPALTISKVYSENINRLQLVSASSPTDIQVADDGTIEEATVMGVCLEDGLTGVTGRIHILGVLEDPSFAYAVNAPLFLGTSGAITDTPTTISGKFVTQIGYSLGSGAIFINISEPSEIL